VRVHCLESFPKSISQRGCEGPYPTSFDLATRHCGKLSTGLLYVQREIAERIEGSETGASQARPDSWLDHSQFLGRHLVVHQSRCEVMSNPMHIFADKQQLLENHTRRIGSQQASSLRTRGRCSLGNKHSHPVAHQQHKQYSIILMLSVSCCYWNIIIRYFAVASWHHLFSIY